MPTDLFFMPDFESQHQSSPCGAARKVEFLRPGNFSGRVDSPLRPRYLSLDLNGAVAKW